MKRTHVAHLALVAIATFAPAVAAAASPGKTLVQMGTKLLDETVGFGIGAALDNALGLSADTPAELSESAYAAIDSIVYSAVQAGRFADHMIDADQAVLDGQDYYRDPSDLDWAFGEADAVMSGARDVAVAMETFELRGMPTWVMMKALELGFRHELAAVEDARGRTTSAQFERDRLQTRAGAALDHVRAMEAIWVEDAAHLYGTYRKVSRRWLTFEHENKDVVECFQGPNGEVCSTTTYRCWINWAQAPWDGSLTSDFSCDSNAAALAEAEGYRQQQLSTDKAAIFGDVGALKAQFSVLSGRPICPLGTFDGMNCFVGWMPAGAWPFVLDGGLYTTPQTTTSCPAGNFDGANCHVLQAPAGTWPFVYAGGLYTTPVNGSCPMGSFDGANCFIAPIPAQTSGFVYAGGLYTTPRQTTTCSLGTFDGANCYVGDLLGVGHFVYQGGLYTWTY